MLVRPSSTAQTAALMAQLADSSQQAQLGSQLQTAGFALVPNTLQSALSIQSEVVTVPATSPAADSATGKANVSTNHSIRASLYALAARIHKLVLGRASFSFSACKCTRSAVPNPVLCVSRVCVCAG